ncbi:response regulator transcription factor [Termitidicoccus mucosus]|uniref:LuxR family transcriptional regulator n=1 Tax=Termitidicoccus mucosus TaxID=1184151 RepID=A0A178IHF8_9BACT|nr:hypothetical protein AW736_15260 [Opitutaceae bacterium TSB47]
MPISVAIVEDNSDLAEEITQIITDAPDLQLACCCRNVRAALSRIPAAEPDVVIMDINLPDGSGIEATARLKQQLPRTEVMIFTIYEDSDEIFHALEAGASGYLLKRAPTDELLRSIRDIMDGNVPMTSEVARKVIQSFQKKRMGSQVVNATADRLTPRETDILELLAKGFPSKEIASLRCISVQTVNSHLKNIYDKLHVHSRTEAVIKYLG